MIKLIETKEKRLVFRKEALYKNVGRGERVGGWEQECEGLEVENFYNGKGTIRGYTIHEEWCVWE